MGNADPGTVLLVTCLFGIPLCTILLPLLLFIAPIIAIIQINILRKLIGKLEKVAWVIKQAIELWELANKRNVSDWQ